MKRTAEQKRAIRRGTQLAMRRRAEARRCPHCSRKSAMVTLPNTYPTIRVCRFCRHETCAVLEQGT